MTQIHFGVLLPGNPEGTAWRHPQHNGQLEFTDFVREARRAEAAKLDFVFLAEGLRVNEHRGELDRVHAVGRFDPLPTVAALAALTSRIGFVSTANTTFNEPYELARQFASLDLLTGGRAGWNVVTSHDAFTGANFRGGGYLPYEKRYTRASEFIAAAQQLWRARSEPNGSSGEPGEFAYSSDQFAIHGRWVTPRTPQIEPVIVQAGDSADGRELAARFADAIFTHHDQLEDGRAFKQDIDRRTVRAGRPADSVKVLPAASVVLAGSLAEATEKARYIRDLQTSGAKAVVTLERVWNRDLSDHDPDGPLPSIEPDIAALPDAGIRRARIEQWRAYARPGLSTREIIRDNTPLAKFVGAPEDVANAIQAHVISRACDGYILAPHFLPGGLDDFYDFVIPLLQERNVFRSDYSEDTLRGHLGLAALSGVGAR